MNLVVGVGDMKVSNKLEDTIVTYALGSCIGVSIYDPFTKAGGILHYMLPQSKLSNNKAVSNPYMFADTGIPRLFKSVYALGGEKSKIIVKAAGGSQLLDDNEFFAIGKRNYIMLKKILWKNRVLIKSEHIGGSLSRTMYLEIASGKMWLKVKNQRIEL